MSTIDERRARASAGVALAADTDGWYGDFARPRVILSPIAAPSVLGLFGFAGATFIVAANLAGSARSRSRACSVRSSKRTSASSAFSERWPPAPLSRQHWAGWVFVVSALLAWYVASAMMLKASAGRTILPLFKGEREANVPGRRPTRPIQLEWAEPGVKMGQ